jgi:succinate dehydrogenase/fumarate reductase cytochrome b subunit
MALRPTDEARIPWWIRLQQAIGLLPLTLFAGFHVWLNWPALSGRSAWLERVRGHALSTALVACVLGSFALHAVLGLARALRGQRMPKDARASFQGFTGGLLLFFLAYHLTHVWTPSAGAHAALSDSYERLWQLLGRPIPLVVYVLGSAALSFHLAHGWSRMLEASLPRALRSVSQYTAGIAGLAMFVLYLQLLGWFALGEAVFPFAAPAHQPEVVQQQPLGAK